MNTKQTTTSKVNTRLLAFLVALGMLLAIVPITVFAGTGTQTDPYKSTDKNNGEDGTCLVLYQCDENGNIIQSLEKYNTSASGYQYSLSQKEPTTIYVKLAYKDGSAFNPNDWLFKNDTTAVQANKVMLMYTAATDAFDVKVNGTSFKDAANKRVWLDVDKLYRIDFPINNTGTGIAGLMRLALGDGSNFANATTFGVVFAINTFGDINKTGIDAATIADIPAQTYTGEALTPELNITYDGKTLVKDTDYTVEFADNTEVGTASVTITGIGDFDWHVTKTFEIKAPPATSNTWITFPEGISFVDCDDNTDYYQADKPLAFNKDGTITFTYKVNGAQRYGHVALQNADGSTPAKATATEPDGNDRVATLADLSDKTDYRLYWDKTKTNGRLTKDIVLTFTTAEHEHVAQKVDAVPATCIEAGSTEGSKCSICGEWIVEPETIPALGHTEEIVPGKAATCTEKGLTEGKKCSVCDTVLEEQKEIPALGHKEEVVKGKAATCTEKGLTDGKKCSVCDTVLEEQKEIDALGHDFKDGKCTRCDAADPDYKPTPVEPVSKFTGLANEADKDGNWWYYTDGKIDKTHTGVDQNKYGWWRVENGKVNFNAQSIYQNENGWWKTTDGKVTFKENSIYQNQYGWWKCKDSKVDFTAQSIYQNQYGWWKTTNGKVTFKENGLFKNQYGTWKVENSKVNFNYNGTYQGKTIKNGKVQ